MKRKSLNGHLGDAYFLGLVKAIARSDYQITELGTTYINSSISYRRTFIKDKVCQLNCVQMYIELLNKSIDPNMAFENTISVLRITQWNDVSISWKHKILRNWLIYAPIITPKRKGKQSR